MTISRVSKKSKGFSAGEDVSMSYSESEREVMNNSRVKVSELIKI
jgi:hypothetical protein